MPARAKAGQRPWWKAALRARQRRRGDAARVTRQDLRGLSDCTLKKVWSPIVATW
jgi:hypothetical protein